MPPSQRYPKARRPRAGRWHDDPPGGVGFAVARGGYLQALDVGRLADWAHGRGVVIRLWVRPGDYVPVGFPAAFLSVGVDHAEEAIAGAPTVRHRPAALQDLESSIRQLVEIAVRALSPGISDPFTAGSVIDHLGDAQCRIARRHLPTDAVAREGRIASLHPVTDYDGLCDAMFRMIRQNAAGSVHAAAHHRRLARVRSPPATPGVGSAARTAGGLAVLLRPRSARRHAGVAAAR